jgi:plastocyanin
MKTLVLLIIATIFLASNMQSQNVGIGTTTPMAQLAVGSASQFRVSSTGNLIRINNVPYSFPADTLNDTNQYLKNDGSGNLTWTPAPRPVVRIFSAVAVGISAWAIDNPADYGSNNNQNPTLTLQKGFTYRFTINAPGHPFMISTAPSSGSYNIGVSNNGEDVGIITFTVPMDAPATLYYYCTAHNTAMKGILNIL